MHPHVHMIREAVKVPRCNGSETLTSPDVSVQRNDTRCQVCEVVADTAYRLYVDRPPEGAVGSDGSECGIVPRELRHETVFG
jgi:hypothetical protein